MPGSRYGASTRATGEPAGPWARWGLPDPVGGDPGGL